ncbi:hypothetical protein Dsin_021159 [Dipteronia sinensis]|uniref:Uncharacterized protein n=1 Tax=Dipteronia sinensis TaxID=43782 RepID=A0AAE0ABR6_9ROSI|nr:hypothetical protein Dsin_021159 [Dipteronia sinensis]
MERGSSWRVGCGRSLYIYKDRWIPRPLTFKVASSPVLGEWATMDSLKLPSGDWNAVLIKNSFFIEEAKAILRLPSCASYLDDSLFWHFDKSGIFPVKSGYWLARNSFPNPSCSGLNPTE